MTTQRHVLLATHVYFNHAETYIIKTWWK
jgi:hypothetical protein